MNFPKANYDYGEHSNLDMLLTPPIEFWPVYSYGVRGTPTREDFAKSLDSMAARGIRGLYVLPYTNSFAEYYAGNFIEEYEYLSDGWMEMIKTFVEEAEKRGILLWLYDEAGWPSGSCNGFVVRDNPELRLYALDREKNKIDTPMAQPYPDLCNKQASETFIRYTHERFSEYFGDFGSHFRMTFTDEPIAGTNGWFDRVYWTDGLEEKFRDAFGYDIMPYFELLFQDVPCTEEARRVRADYHDLVSRLFVENYLTPIREFCHRNGALATGHMQGDDAAIVHAKWGYHHLLRCLRAMDVPGVDVIWRQIFPGPQLPKVEPWAPLCANTFFPRYASSASHQTGAKLSLAELFGVYGMGMTFSQRRWVSNFLFVRGINILNPMTLEHSYEGRQYAGAYAGFSDKTPGADDLYGYNLWAARASYLMSAGQPIADAALYIPLYDIWAGDEAAWKIAEGFEALGAELEGRGCDIDIIDDDAILAAEMRDGALCIGHAAYKTLYLHPDSTLNEAVKEKLEAWRAQGGTVVICQGEWHANAIISASDSSFRVARRATEEGRVYYLTSEAFSSNAGEVRFLQEDAKFAYEINLSDGSRRAVSVSPYICELELGEERVLLFPEDALTEADEEIKNPEHAVELTEFSARRIRKITPTERGLEEEQIDEPYRKISLGDWRDTFSADFSGDTVYRTSFKANGEMKNGAILDLGDVRYTCEVFLNGKSLGAKIFAPFRYELPALAEENELLIRISNTLANTYRDVHFEEWFTDWRPDYLYNLARGFQEESLPSGLFGPVLLKY